MVLPSRDWWGDLDAPQPGISPPPRAFCWRGTMSAAMCCSWPDEKEPDGCAIRFIYNHPCAEIPVAVIRAAFFYYL